MNSLNSPLSQAPWLILGDFNSILSRVEHRGGSFSYYSCKSCVFNAFIDSNNLLDLKYVSSTYTWCNNQHGSTRRWARLECFLVNLKWSNFFKSYTFSHLTRSFSDHSPIFLTVNLLCTHKKRLFRLENFWVDYLGCHNCVRDAWNFSPHGNPCMCLLISSLALALNSVTSVSLGLITWMLSYLKLKQTLALWICLIIALN